MSREETKIQLRLFTSRRTSAINSYAYRMGYKSMADFWKVQKEVLGRTYYDVLKEVSP
jgi:hypothetical protein